MNDLHSANFWSAAERAGREGCADHVERVEFPPDDAFDVGHEVNKNPGSEVHTPDIQ